MTAPATADRPPARTRTGAYVLVLVIEAVTIVALWVFGCHFTAP